MTHRELHVTYADGVERIVATERDDSDGRRKLDAMAFAYMGRPNVTAARTIPVQRIASTTGRRTYR